MDERVFGPYYGTPPENRTHPSASVQAFNRPITAPRRTLRARLLAGRKRRPRTRTPH